MQTAKIPATIVTGFLGSGKTTLLRHILDNADGRRIAVIVNEFGELGIDGEILKGCGIGCDDEGNEREGALYELANGCMCSAPSRSLPSSRSEEHTSELQSQSNLVCRLLLEKK